METNPSDDDANTSLHVISFVGNSPAGVVLLEFLKGELEDMAEADLLHLQK